MATFIEGSAGPSERLSNSVIWAYCLPFFGMNGIGILFSVYLMMYATDVLLIAPAVMGVIFGIGRVWDAISDPVAGYLSDRSQARIGSSLPTHPSKQTASGAAPEAPHLGVCPRTDAINPTHLAEITPSWTAQPTGSPSRKCTCSTHGHRAVATVFSTRRTSRMA